MSTALEKITAQIENRLRTMANLEDTAAKEFIAKLDELRRLIVTLVAQEQEISANVSGQIKSQIEELVQRFRPQLEQVLTENQERLFIKGLRLIDGVLKTGDLTFAIPFLSDQLLAQAKAFGAELITGITDDIRARVATEINLAVMGQKPINEVLKGIGKNLTDPSVFGTVSKRAEIILRTEVNRIGNMATFNRMKQVSGQVPDLEKSWLHSHQGTPRPGHLKLDGVRVRMTEKFQLIGKDGETYQVDGPYDAILPAGEVINCRCHVIPVVGRFEKTS